MTESVRETALKGLKTLCGVAFPLPSGVLVERNVPTPSLMPRAGRVNMNDGDPGEPEEVLSPLTYLYEHRAELVVQYTAVGDDDRDTELDALLRTFDQALASDPTLGGAVNNARLDGTVEFETYHHEGTAPIKSAKVTVILDYQTTSPLS